MKRSLARLAPLILAGFAGGCLEFKEQTMSYRYDGASDTLRIFQDYRGIFGGDAEGKPDTPLSDEELGQLTSVLNGGRTFFFENWIFEYNREQLETARADLEDPGEQADSAYEAEDIPQFDELLGLAIENVRIEDGRFYLGEEGELCGVQSVTVKDFTKLVAAVNRCAPFFMSAISAKGGTTPADRQAIAKFTSRRDSTLLEQKGNALTLRWPLSRAGYESNFGDKLADPTDVEEMRAAGLGIAWVDDVVTFSLGREDDAITRLTLGSSGRDYTPNAVAPARKLHGIEDGLDPEASARAFLLPESRRPRE